MQIPEARKWYRWLWWSPLLTIPTLLWVYFSDPGYSLVCGSSYEGCAWWIVAQMTNIIAVAASAMWHLILLKPALDKERPFVRWHGRQALLLAGVRTAIPLFIAVIMTDEYALLNAIPYLIVVWFFGTIWGQRQAARGDCSVLRWFAGRDGETILATVAWEKEAIDIDKQTKGLVYAIRFGRSREQREKALAELEALGLVETL